MTRKLGKLKPSHDQACCIKAETKRDDGEAESKKQQGELYKQDEVMQPLSKIFSVAATNVEIACNLSFHTHYFMHCCFLSVFFRQ